MKTHVLIEGAVRPESFLLAWGEQSHTCYAVLSEDLELLWCNGAAQESLGRFPELDVRAGRLTMRDSEVHAEFVRSLSQAGDTRSSYCVPCNDGKGHVVLWFQVVDRIDGRRIFSLIFRRTSEAGQPRYADITRAFGLTEAEGVVVGRLIAGFNAEVVSKDLGVSIETTRTHIRRIYLKMGVRSREALFHKLRPYCL